MIVINNEKIIFQSGDYKSVKSLIPGVWVLSYNELEGFYLSKTNDFTLLKKYYGDIENKSEKILKSFNSSNKNLGVLFTGLKGTGKTQLARKIAIDSKLPIVIIAQKYQGTDFIKVINNLDSCVVLFDEFDKTFPNKEDQNVLLSLLDGFDSEKKIFIFTSNSIYNYNNYLQNRPSRIRYNITYSKIDPSIVKELAEELLEDKTKIEGILKYSKIIEDCSIDIIKELINECNTMNLTPTEAIEDMNISIGGSSGERTCYNITFESKKFPKYKLFKKEVITNPFKSDGCRLEITKELFNYYPQMADIFNRINNDTLDDYSKDYNECDIKFKEECKDLVEALNINNLDELSLVYYKLSESDLRVEDNLIIIENENQIITMEEVKSKRSNFNLII